MPITARSPSSRRHLVAPSPCCSRYRSAPATASVCAATTARATSSPPSSEDDARRLRRAEGQVVSRNPTAATRRERERSGARYQDAARPTTSGTAPPRRPPRRPARDRPRPPRSSDPRPDQDQVPVPATPPPGRPGSSQPGRRRSAGSPASPSDVVFITDRTVGVGNRRGDTPSLPGPAQLHDGDHRPPVRAW